VARSCFKCARPGATRRSTSVLCDGCYVPPEHRPTTVPDFPSGGKYMGRFNPLHGERPELGRIAPVLKVEA
jgi:hypothetical protein